MKKQIINYKKYIYYGIFFFISFQSIQAKELQKEENIKLYIINWKDPLDNKVYSNCDNVIIKLPHWASATFNSIKINKNFNKNYYISNSTFLLYCKHKDINLNKSYFVNDYVFFDSKMQKWNIFQNIENNVTKDFTKNHSDSIKTFTLYPLKSPNGFGWAVTAIEFDFNNNDPNLIGYIKHLTFCLFNNKKTQQLCGEGDVQYIFKDYQHPDLIKGDYTPYLIQILETVKFIDDK